MAEFRAAVINDLQIPFEDRDAVDVAQQIIRDFKPEVLVLNGDIWDLLNLSAHPTVKTQINERSIVELESEIDRGVTLLKRLVKETKPERILITAGNHEFRVMRAIANADTNAKKLLELKVIRDAYRYESIFRFNELGVPFKHAGEYPRGLWLHPSLPPEKNFWIEHGYIARKKTGFTANALLEDRMSNVLTGHCERLCMLWRSVNGDRHFCALENGNLSMLGVPGKGDGIYFGVPLSVPDYRNSEQGLTLLTHVSDKWFPQVIRISQGTSFWGKKLYKTRLK